MLGLCPRPRHFPPWANSMIAGRGSFAGLSLIAGCRANYRSLGLRLLPAPCHFSLPFRRLGLTIGLQIGGYSEYDKR